MSTISSPPVAADAAAVKPPVGWSARRARGRVGWTPLIVILLFHVGALLVFVPAFFSLKALITAFVLQFFCALGIGVGYHRLLTHRSFKTIKPIEYMLSWLGSLSLQGGPIRWVATHRLHHQHSDQDEDPHSPQHGFFWAHALWCFAFDPQFDPYEKYSRYAQDLARDRGHRIIEFCTPFSQLAVGVALYFFGGWSCVVWAGFLRLVWVYHITWFVNSATHTWGYQTYKTGDHSTNLWWVALLSLGEGWHNNHHAFPNSARHGLKRSEIDVSWMCIRLLVFLRLASDVRLPANPDGKRISDGDAAGHVLSDEALAENTAMRGEAAVEVEKPTRELETAAAE